MEIVEQKVKNAPEAGTGEVLTPPLLPDVVIQPVPKDVLERLRAEIPVLMAHQEAILARRSGKPFTEEELNGALQEARAAHERGE